ncbi:expressed unknown protein [Seminavis robusta]|uniref:RING-type domain-containing protein n=1 Tax=Seminavis robusta TaxID=568900 RepID=A0A9N8EDD8_9STRA|nr:expressed unknown protein [Seminavis robusta]|eukprot:Sro779_g201390.1 n/a (299) ;mRNA; f:43968-44864
MASLQGMPVSVLYEQVIYPQLQAQVGRSFKIAHLKSERGQALNGKLCKVTGFDRDQDQARVHCWLISQEEKKKKLSLKWQNLIPLEANQALENFMTASTPIADDILVPCLERAIQKHDHADRPDLMHRLRLYGNLLQKIRQGTAQDADYCFPCGGGSELLNNAGNFGRVMQLSKPGCYGNESNDMRFMDLGLKGDDQTECAICQDVLRNDTSIVLVTLPCLHVFHKGCIQQWLSSNLGQQNWSCPSCRKTVPGDMSIYCIEYNEQLQRRIDEYPLSGFCIRCMIMIMENNRHEELPIV